MFARTSWYVSSYLDGLFFGFKSPWYKERSSTILSVFGWTLASSHQIAPKSDSIIVLIIIFHALFRESATWAGKSWNLNCLRSIFIRFFTAIFSFSSISWKFSGLSRFQITIFSGLVKYFENSFDSMKFKTDGNFDVKTWSWFKFSPVTSWGKDWLFLVLSNSELSKFFEKIEFFLKKEKRGGKRKKRKKKEKRSSKKC